MIQNAEDSNSSEIVFTINEKEIIIENNGRLFNEKDVTSITEVGSSTKQDTDTIGMFGLGFKSVFLLSDTPIIRSGNFNFSFNSNTCIYPHLELPQPKEFDPGKTYVILPLKSNLVSGILHSIRNHYYKISELFLFLKSLKKIKIEDDKEGEIIFEKKINENITTIYETRQGYPKEIKSKWIILSKTFPIKNQAFQSLKEGDKRINKDKVTIDFAFQLSTNNELMDEGNKVLCSFLATKYSTNLPFIINSDFQLTSNREGIKEDSEWNKHIFDCALDLFKESIEFFKSKEEYKSIFYGILPKRSSCPPDKDILRTFYDGVHSYCSKNEIVLSGSDHFVLGEKCYFDDVEVSSILDNKTLKKLENMEFISSKIPNKYHFIITHFGIKRFNENKLLTFLQENSNFISGIGGIKLLELYSLLARKFPTNLVEKIRKIQLIKLEDKTFKSLDDLKIEPAFYKDEHINSTFINDQTINLNYTDSTLWGIYKKSSVSNLKFFFDILDKEGLLIKFDINSYLSKYLMKAFEKKSDESDLFKITRIIKEKYELLTDDSKKTLKEKLLLKSKSGKWEKASSMCFSKKYCENDLFDMLSEDFDIKVISDEYFLKSDNIQSWNAFFADLGLNRHFIVENVDRYHGGIDHGAPSIKCNILKDIFDDFPKMDEVEKIKISKKIFKNIDENWDYYKSKLVLKSTIPNIKRGREIDVSYNSSEVETDFLVMLKKNDWVPTTTKEVLRPDEVYLDKANIRKYNSSLPRINLDYSLTNSEMITVLGLKENLDADVYIQDLINLKNNSKNFDVGDCEHLYSEISSSLNQNYNLAKEEAVRDKFFVNKLVYLPTKQNTLWLDPNECFMNADNLLNKYTPALGTLYHDKNCHKLFTEYLKISEYPKVDDYLRLLQYLESTKIKEESLTDIFKIYKKLNSDLEENSNKDPEWLSYFVNGRFLVSNRFKFCKKEEIYFNDDHQLTFNFEKDVDYLNFPLSSHSMIRLLLNKLKLEPISAHIRKSISSHTIINKTSLGDYLKNLETYERGILEYISKHFDSQNSRQNNLSELNIYFVDKLEIDLTFGKISKKVMFEEYFDETSRIIYLQINEHKNLNSYKNQLSRAISQFYQIPELSDHIFRLIQHCMIDGGDIFQFYKQEGILLAKGKFDVSSTSITSIEESNPKELIEPYRTKKIQRGDNKIIDSVIETTDLKLESDINEDEKSDASSTLDGHGYSREKFEEYEEDPGVLYSREVHDTGEGEIKSKTSIWINDEPKEEPQLIEDDDIRPSIGKRLLKLFRMKTPKDSEIKKYGAIESQNRQHKKKNEGVKPTDVNPILSTEIPLSEEEKEHQLKKIKELCDNAKNNESSKIVVEKLNKYTIRKDNDVKQQTKEDLYLWYRGKCQVCGKTFTKKDGKNYFEIHLINKTDKWGGGGLIIAGNTLCLCPWHKAKIEHSKHTDRFVPTKIKNLKLHMNISGKEETLHFEKEHYLFVKAYWEM